MSADEIVRACALGDVVEVLRLLPRVKNPEHVRSRWSERTLLHYSCLHGWLDVTKKLVERYHCHPESRDWHGDTPLHKACREGHVDIVRYLVSERGCSTACQNKDGNTPLHEACKTGRLDVVEFLLTAKDCSTACSKRSQILLHYPCRHGWLDVTRKLVEKYHCHPECRDKAGDTPLHEACGNGHVDIVRYLVSERGCSTACQNKDGNTPLHEACKAGWLDVVEILLTAQDCITACSKHSQILLHYTCHHGWLDVTRRLVEQYRCNPESRDKNVDTPLHEACRGGYVDIVRYLVSERGCRTACQNKYMFGDTPLLEACRDGRLAVVEILLTAQDCSTACNEHSRILLHYSCHHGWLDVTRRLVEQCHCDPESRDMYGDTLLHEACRKGHGDIVRYLVSERGCSTACQNKDGNTPLHMACICNSTDVVRFLLASGRADPWFRNASNETPLQCSSNYTIAKLLASVTGLSNDIPSATKIFVFGNPSAGKSTLVKVIENKVTSWFGTFAGQFRNVSGVETKTAGISIVTIQSRSSGTVTVYDLAGQFEYYSSHDALVGNLMSSSAAIFIVVVKLSESEADVIQTLQYWISFIENCCSRVKATAHLMVIGSWADKVKEAGENVDQKWLNIKKACIPSSCPRYFVGFAALDCRKLASSGLDIICDMIESSCTALREAKALERKEIIYPHLLHAFISTKLTKVACSVEELCTHITAEDDALLPTERSLLSPLLSSLSDGGHLLYLPNKREFVAGWVIIDKQALLSEINGTIFAPDNFKHHHDIATSTGVVPKSKVANVFAKKYSTDMILSVLTLFEFCHKINDSFTLSLIADNDPSRDSATAITTGDESLESYFFFPALVRVERPTDVWQSSGLGEYQCGWCLQCSTEGQYLTPWFLQVLLLRLAFSFALVPDTSQQDRASPVLRRRCAIWKNGIQWLDQDGVETIVEVSEQNRVVLLLMSCSEGEEMACVRLRASLISKVLEAREELCPGISTTELLIDPSNVSTYPLPSSSELTLYSVADQVVKAVRECKPSILDTTGRKKLKLEKALHFESYHGIQVKCINRLFAKDSTSQEVGDCFLQDLAANIHTMLMEQIPMREAFRMFNIPDDREFYNYCEQFPKEKYNPVMRCFRLFLTWKKYDTDGATYRSLRTTLDKYSIFCGRNPLVRIFFVV